MVVCLENANIYLHPRHPKNGHPGMIQVAETEFSNTMNDEERSQSRRKKKARTSIASQTPSNKF